MKATKWFTVFSSMLLLIGIVFSTNAVEAESTEGGPVILMGIDAEDGGPGGHGPISAYESIVKSLLDNVTNDGEGILVIGGGKSDYDHVTKFYNAIELQVNVPLDYVNEDAIQTKSFDGYALIIVVSDYQNTNSGGLTVSENSYLAQRVNDIANFVNSGGGLLGFSSTGFNNPYAYLGEVGDFSFNFPSQFQNITPTQAGIDIGITENNLDICCWHDEYTSFPSFLETLATNPSTGNAAAVGGQNVVVTPSGYFDRKITGGGYLTENHSFGFNIKPSDEEGVNIRLEYNDHQKESEPVQIKVKNHTTQIQEIKDSEDNVIGAEFDVMAKMRSSNKSDYVEGKVRVRVIDNGEPGVDDVFELIVIDGELEGYTSGQQNLIRGNIQLHKKASEEE